ncbi:MAG: dTMP kinase [Chlamydiales bacterium]|nr:dTMP kinase [Chlamydiales bacterium]
MSGLLITFEGGEGAGKSTLIERLFDALNAKNLPVVKTRAPGGTRLGEVIRNLLLNKEEAPLCSHSELLLFLADRAQHVEEIIAPALKKRQIVLCDRFNDSTVAYQGAARGLGEEDVRKLCSFACQGVEPNLTFYLDLDPAVGLKRVKQTREGRDKIEAEKILFHQKIRHAFHRIAEKELSRFHILDASRSSDEVFKQAMERIDALLLSTPR